MSKGRLLLCAGLASCLVACGSADPCRNLVNKSRTTTETCLAKKSPDLYSAGSFHDQGRVYSVMWIEYDFYDPTTSLWPDFCDDQGFRRQLVVFEHVSGDASTADPMDRVVYWAERRCAWQVHCDGGYSILRDDLSWERGQLPIPDFPFTCDTWPAHLVSQSNVIMAETCYQSRLCPAGTLCDPVNMGVECPPDGSICLPPEELGTYSDVDDDGQPNCRDDDADDDGLSNEEEWSGSETGFETDPFDPDTDGDGVLDPDDPMPVSSLCASILYYEDFTDDPATAWTNVTGEWVWDGDTYASTGASGLAKSWLSGESFTDAVFFAQVRIDSDINGTAGLFYGLTDLNASQNGGHGYYFGCNPGANECTFGRIDGGWDLYQRVSMPISGDTWYTLQMAHTDAGLQVWFNEGFGVPADPLVTVDWLHSPITGTVGLRSLRLGATFDRLIVCQPGP